MYLPHRISTILLLTCIIAGSAHALFQPKSPMDVLLENSDVVLKATVTDLKVVCAIPEKNRYSFTATPQSIIKTDSKQVPEHLFIEALGTINYHMSLAGFWPYKDQSIIMFLRRDGTDRLVPMGDHNAFIPVYGESPTPQSPPASPCQALYYEFKATAAKHPNPKAKAQFQTFMASVATPEQLADFAPPISDDPWLQFSSTLATAKIDPQPSRIQAVVELLKTHETLLTSPNNSFEPDVFDDLWRAARCNHHDGNVDLINRAKAYLPIYRYFLDHAPADAPKWSPKYFGVSPSIDAMDFVGTRDDIPRLWKFRHFPSEVVRFQVLEIVARMLGTPTKRPRVEPYGDGPTPQELVDWEAKTQSTLEALMATQGDAK